MLEIVPKYQKDVGFSHAIHTNRVFLAFTTLFDTYNITTG